MRNGCGRRDVAKVERSRSGHNRIGVRRADAGGVMTGSTVHDVPSLDPDRRPCPARILDHHWYAHHWVGGRVDQRKVAGVELDRHAAVLKKGSQVETIDD